LAEQEERTPEEESDCERRQVKRRILITPAADQDIKEQAAYLAQNESAALGLRFLRAAEQTCQLLAGHAEIGVRTECRSVLLSGMRMLPMKRFTKHLFFYRIVKGDVEIIRILHGARDIEALFLPDPEAGESLRISGTKGKVN
jgi:toxin ParE1/3/4